MELQNPVSRVRRVSSMSPWRQFWPSIWEMEPMLPAPKACLERVRRMRVTRRGKGREVVRVAVAILGVVLEWFGRPKGL